ncbi:MAG: Gfo/Idh/MocA family oxidoreductase [Pirellulaceae bacterium]|nr:Gfo/Idh/MocA family oxidoreductase [Pirellulaceae bacterium]
MAFGFGIIGCGMISRFHQRAIADIGEAELIGCTDEVLPAAQAFADEAGCHCYQSIDEMVADDRIQIVTICTPSGAHLEPALAAIEHKKHVIIEKPLEINPSRCDEIIQAADSQGVVVSTVFQSRFHASSCELKQAVDEGRFGRLTLGDAYVKWHRSQEYYDQGAWRGTWKLDGGGAFMNQAIHSVDLLLWLMGPVAEIRAQMATLAHERIEVEDVAIASLRFQSGALGSMEATTASYPGMFKRIEIHGTEGSAVLEEEDIKVWDFANPTERDEQIREELANRTETAGAVADPAAMGHHGHTLQFGDVIAAIKEGRAAQIDGAEGRRSVEVICGIYESAQSGKPVVFG